MTPPFPAKKYDLIVVDPPWPIAKIKKRVRPNQVHMDYRLMSIAQIMELPVKTLAAENCVVFLWVIDKYLHSARAILEGWGFKYHLTMAWDKTNGLAMYGFNRQTEFILVGFCGAHPAYPARRTVRTSLTANATGHSIKPDAFYEALTVWPAVHKLDMFARKPREGWDVWGDGVS